MQRAVKERVIPVRFSEEELEAVHESMEKIGTSSRSEFIREAVRHYLDTVKEMKVIQIRDVTKTHAKKEILEYLIDKKEAETFDIANDLRLDLDLTVRALKELWEEGSIT